MKTIFIGWQGSRDWILFLEHQCHPEDYSHPLSANFRRDAVEKFPLIQSAAGRQALNIKCQEHILKLRVLTLLSAESEIVLIF